MSRRTWGGQGTSRPGDTIIVDFAGVATAGQDSLEEEVVAEEGELEEPEIDGDEGDHLRPSD